MSGEPAVLLDRLVVDLRPGELLDHDDPLWQRAIVFVLRGSIEVTCPLGERHVFRRGAVLSLARLQLVAVRGAGRGRTRVLAIRRTGTG